MQSRNSTYKKRGALIAFLMAAVMVASGLLAVPMSVEGSSAYADGGEVTNKDIEELFGLEGTSFESDMDPTFKALKPLEMVSWYGGDKESVKIREIGSWGGSYGELDTQAISADTDSYHSISFAAALGSVLDQDWYCVLFYDDYNKKITFSNFDLSPKPAPLKLLVMNKENELLVNVDELVGTTPYNLDSILNVSTLEAGNILRYAVGDFDNDGRQEIAIHHWFSVYVLGYNGKEITLEREYELAARSGYSSDNGYENSLYTPVSLTAGDIDGDGFQELLVARGFYDKKGPGIDEHSILYIFDMNEKKPESSWYKIKIEGFTSGRFAGAQCNLDSVMTSVAVGDIDHDNEKDIVVGGYAWDNKVNDPDLLKLPNTPAGEMYLASTSLKSLDADNHVIKFERCVALMDDDNNAATRYSVLKDGAITHPISNDYKRFQLVGRENNVDTSIYVTDGGLGLCRNVNWSNWTIPLATCSLSGIDKDTGYDFDQIYFNTWFYDFSGQDIKVFADAYFKDVPDNNNVMCQTITVGNFTEQNVSENLNVNGNDQMAICFGLDLESNWHNGDTEWGYVIYRMNGDKLEELFSNNSKLTGTYDYRNGRLYDGGRTCFGNFDDDYVYYQFLAREHTYIEPNVVAYLSAIPCQGEYREMLGEERFGKTVFKKISGKSIGVEMKAEENVTLTAFGVSAGLVFEQGWKQTRTVEETLGFMAYYDDTVILTVQPVDVYYYKIRSFSGGNVNEDTVAMPVPSGQTVSRGFTYKDYSTLMEGLGKTPFKPGHTVGDLSTYKEAPDGGKLLFGKGAIIECSYPTTGKSHSIKVEDSTEIYAGSGVIVGGDEDISIAKFKAEATVMVTGHHTYMSGIEFEYSLDAINNMELSDIVGQYRMTGSMWAQSVTLDSKEGTDKFVYIGFTVYDYELGMKSVSLSESSDERFLATNSSFCMNMTIPAVTNGEDHRPTAKEHTLQYRLPNKDWLDFGTSDMSLYEWDDGAGDWKSVESTFNQTEYKTSKVIKVSNIDPYHSGVLEFRFKTVNGGTDESTRCSYSDVVTAVLSSHNTSYTVTFVADTENYTPYYEKQYKYGETIELPPTNPMTKSDGIYNIEFSGWSGYRAGMTVSGDHVFTAMFDRYLASLDALLESESPSLNLDDNARLTLRNNEIQEILQHIRNNGGTFSLESGEGAISFDASSFGSMDWITVQVSIKESSVDVTGGKGATYDVDLSDANSPVTRFGSGGMIKVSLRYDLGNQDPDSIRVYYVQNGKTTEEFECEYEEIDGVGYVTFQTSHLSTYAVIPSEEGSDEESGTFSPLMIGGIVVLIVGILVVAVAMRRRSKNWRYCQPSS